jgi:glycosyltransferase involved in cell wall biosynthesis
MAVSVPPTWKSFFRPAYAYRFVRSLVALFWFLRRSDPDVVNQHFFMTTALHFALLKPLFGYRLVLSCHGSDVKHLRAMHRRAAPFILSRTDAVTCVSQSLVDTLEKQVPELPTTHVIPNGIDYDFWQLDEASSDTRQEKQLISVGSLKRVKGHDVLIRAFPKVLEEHPDATLRLVGDGPKQSEYEKMTEDLGVTDCIDFAGWLTEVEVRSSLRKATLFVFPSRHEGFGIALLEAMAAGCPVVASNVGGIPEVVRGADAMLVPPEDSNALAEAINAVLRDEGWRETARSSVIERAAQFTWASAVDRYEDCLRGA